MGWSEYYPVEVRITTSLTPATLAMKKSEYYPVEVRITTKKSKPLLWRAKVRVLSSRSKDYDTARGLWNQLRVVRVLSSRSKDYDILSFYTQASYQKSEYYPVEARITTKLSIGRLLESPSEYYPVEVRITTKIPQAH